MAQPRINPVAASGFTTGVGAYERARPGYPAALVEVLVADAGLVEGATVVDLAAGTGKLTRLLSPSGARLTAVEPVPAMAATLRLACPGVPVVAGLAERLPLAGASVDLVTVAQGFHWFDADAAFAECRRALRPGGWLALIWNERDETVPWVKTFGDVLDTHGGGRPYVRDRDWGELARAAGFEHVATRRFSNPFLTDRAGVVERAASTSYIAALPDDRREVALAAIAELVEPMDEPITYPHLTDLTLARRP